MQAITRSILCAFLVFFGSALPLSAAQPESESDFQTGFEWRTEGGGGASWGVEGGALVGRGQDYRTRSFLMAETDYSDFLLRLEFNLDRGASSGIAIRGVPGERMPHKDGSNYPYDHPLIKLVEARGVEETGSSYWLRADDSLGINVKPDRPAEMNPAGTWNTLEVEVRGRSLRASVNGRLVINLTSEANARFPDGSLPGLNREKGRFGLQKHTGTVRFRNIRIKSLAGPDTPHRALSPSEAASHVGQRVTVEFTVKSTGSNPAGFLELYSGQTWMEEGSFFIRFPEVTQQKFERLGIADLRKHFAGKTVRVTGLVESVRFQTGGAHLVMVVQDMGQIELIHTVARSVQPDPPPVPTVPSSDETGFQPLFNGRDLSGWRFVGADGNAWVVDGGALVTNGRPRGWLMTTQEFDDFDLRLEYRMSELGNSGVLLRGALIADPFQAGMQIEVSDDEGNPNSRGYSTGAICTVAPRSRRAARPTGEWNAMRIVAKGSQITVFLNDVQVLDADLNDYKDQYARKPWLARARGYIGLESFDGRVEFRNVRVKPLPSAFSAQLRSAGSHTQPILVLNTGGHTGTIWSVMFTPDGRELISVSNDGTIRFWNVQTGETTRVLRPMLIPGGGAGRGALSRDGKLLAVTRSGADGSEQSIYLIALPEGRVTKIIAAGNGGGGRLVFSPDGTRLASATGATATLWNVATGESEQVFRGHRLGVGGLDISPDGRLLATSSGDQTARIWSLETGESLAVLKDTVRQTFTLSSIVFEPDGQGVVTSSWGDLVRVWNLDGTLRRACRFMRTTTSASPPTPPDCWSEAPARARPTQQGH